MVIATETSQQNTIIVYSWAYTRYLSVIFLLFSDLGWFLFALLFSFFSKFFHRSHFYLHSDIYL